MNKNKSTAPHINYLILSSYIFFYGQIKIKLYLKFCNAVLKVCGFQNPCKNSFWQARLNNPEIKSKVQQ